MESSAAKKAANTEANAADYAANIQGDLGQESLANENYQYQQNQANEAPFLQSGANGIATLDYLLGLNSLPPGSTSTLSPQTLSIPGVAGSTTLPGVTSLTGTPATNLGAFGSLMQAYPGGQFTPPTAEQARQTPGYQFALNKGENAVQAGASANGSLLTGGTLNAEQQFGQGLADTNYNTTYNQALQDYNTNYNTWSNNQANLFNRLAAIAGVGQTSAQTLGAQGVQSAGQISNTLANTGSQIGQDRMNAANATGSGYINSANALASGFSGSTNSMSQMMMLNQLMNGGGGFGVNGFSNAFNNQTNILDNGGSIPDAGPDFG
jgi:hypothetical protein